MAELFVLPIHAMVSFTRIELQMQCHPGRGKDDSAMKFYDARFRAAFFAATRFRGFAVNSASSTFFADFQSRSRS